MVFSLEIGWNFNSFHSGNLLEKKRIFTRINYFFHSIIPHGIAFMKTLAESFCMSMTKKSASDFELESFDILKGNGAKI